MFVAKGKVHGRCETLAAECTGRAHALRTRKKKRIDKTSIPRKVRGLRECSRCSGRDSNFFQNTKSPNGCAGAGGGTSSGGRAEFGRSSPKGLRALGKHFSPTRNVWAPTTRDDTQNCRAPPNKIFDLEFAFDCFVS
ncbi:hypothetical protein EVAR_38354_1 [Eumeta japonica]|uniref:Uncharacterized protein n=1 Tax=Eumeta variegata TaxID=151549 RepID=A0A4C1XWI3_EUMVA|nr:hypothetical protein EVAR_38354_1 [Eumeta japonica]